LNRLSKFVIAFAADNATPAHLARKLKAISITVSVTEEKMGLFVSSPSSQMNAAQTSGQDGQFEFDVQSSQLGQRHLSLTDQFCWFSSSRL
jgi:hypothetical protein